MLEPKKIRTIVFRLSLAALLVSGGVHAAAWAGIDLGAGVFILHLAALAALGASILVYNFNYKEIPPRERHLGFLFFLKTRPRWLLVLVVISLFYAAGNFFTLGDSPGGSNIRGFSGSWLAFFAGAALMSAAPATAYLSRFQVEIPAARPPDSFRVPYASVFRRSIEGPVKYLFGFLAFLAAAFGMLTVVGGPLLLVPSGLFVLVLAANVIVRMQLMKFQLTNATVSGGTFSCELCRYNTPERFQYPLGNLKIEFIEEFRRGNSIYALKVSLKDGRELFIQRTSAAWPYDLLKQLYDRLLLG